MGKKWGRVDYRQFQELQKKMEKMERQVNQDFIEACAKELAARLLAKVIKRTPVGQYDSIPGMIGGTLRRGWTAESHKHAELSAAFGGDMAVKNYVNEINITKSGNTYQIEIINPVEYASYVEYGHRTRDHKGWVPGRFMLTISEQELESVAPKVLEKKLTKHLGELFNDQ